MSAIYGELTIGGAIAPYEEMRPCGQTQVLGLETGTNKDWHQQGLAPTRTGTNKGELTTGGSIAPYEEMRPCGQTQVLGLETGTNKDWHQQGPAPTRTSTNKGRQKNGTN